VNALILKVLSDLFTEVTRNLVGLLLVIVGVVVICLGAHWHMDVLVTLGVATLIPAALLALQTKRTPDGNTTTVQTTVPPPAIAAPATPLTTQVPLNPKE
jgi:membrane-bound ClpP family serine protease